MNKMEQVNKAEHISTGKRYTLYQSYLFGFSEQQSQVTIINYQKPSIFEFLVDDALLARFRLSFFDHELDEKKTRCHWEIYSRKKSYLFKVNFSSYSLKFCSYFCILFFYF